MKKQFVLALILLIVGSSVSAQREEHKTVYFKDVRGFNGYVEFDVQYEGFATQLRGKKARLVLEKYDASSEDLKALLKAGYDLRGIPESGYTPEHYAFVVQGQAKIGIISFYGGTENKAKGLSKLQLSESLGDFTTPEFEESMKEAARKWQQENKKSHWEETGSFTDLEVTELYISEFEETIRKILGKAAKERKIENANDAVNEALKAMMYGNLPRAKSLLEKAYKLDPKNERMIRASKEYAVKKKEKDERDFHNMMVEIEIKQRQAREAKIRQEKKELSMLRSWYFANPSGLDLQTKAKLNELEQREVQRNVEKIAAVFDNIRKAGKEELKRKLAANQAEYERQVAALNAQFAREEKEWKEQERRKAEERALQYRNAEKKRLAKYGYKGNESKSEQAIIIRNMIREIPANAFRNGLVPLKYFKWGYVNREGAVMIPFQYDYASDFVNGIAVAGLGDVYVKYEKQQYGYIDKTGKSVTPIMYDRASDFRDGIAIVSSGNKKGIINRAGKLIVPLQYDEISNFSEGLARVSKDGKYGFIDKNGKVVIPLNYEKATSFSDGLAGVKSNGKWGFIDAQHKLVIPYTYNNILFGFANGKATVLLAGKEIVINKSGKSNGYEELSFKKAEGLTPVQSKDKKYGFINENQQLVVPMVYDDVNSFSEGLATVRQERIWGAINKEGKIIIPLKYDAIGTKFQDGIISVTLNGKAGFLDKTGTVAIPLEYDYVSGFYNDGHAVVKKDGHYGAINKSGEVVIPIKYEHIYPFEDHVGLAVASRDGRWGMISLQGKEVISMKYDKVGGFYGSTFALVKRNGKFGGIDASGNYVLKVKYDTIGAFEDDLAIIAYKGKFGYINREGNVIIEPQYEVAHPFYQGLAEVKKSGQTIFIDKAGKELAQDYQVVSKWGNNGVQLVKKENRFGFIDAYKRPVSIFKYDSYEPLDNGLAIVSVVTAGNHQKFGFVNRDGKEVIPLIYDEFRRFSYPDHSLHYVSNGMVQAKIGDLHGLIDTSGKIIAPVAFEYIGEFAEGFARVQNHQQGTKDKWGRWGFINMKGGKLTDYKYNTAWDFSDGLALVYSGDKLGYIDLSGKESIPLTDQYTESSGFSFGMALVRNKDGHWGAIDKTGKQIISCQYAKAEPGKGVAIFQKDGQYGVIDNNGKVLVPFQASKLLFRFISGAEIKDKTGYVFAEAKGGYDLIGIRNQVKSHIPCSNIWNFPDNQSITIFSADNKYGLVNNKGKIIAAAQYDAIYTRANHATVKINGKVGLMNNAGTLVLPVQFDKLKIVSKNKFIAWTGNKVQAFNGSYQPI